MCPFESGKCGKEGENYKNVNILRKKRAFYMISKTFFIVFDGLSFGEKKFDKKKLGHELLLKTACI